jgi:hypothetical protein
LFAGSLKNSKTSRVVLNKFITQVAWLWKIMKITN